MVQTRNRDGMFARYLKVIIKRCHGETNSSKKGSSRRNFVSRSLSAETNPRDKIRNSIHLKINCIRYFLTITSSNRVLRIVLKETRSSIFNVI